MPVTVIVGAFCKVCGGFQQDCPQHVDCPRQDPAVLEAAIATAQERVDELTAAYTKLTEA